MCCCIPFLLLCLCHCHCSLSLQPLLCSVAPTTRLVRCRLCGPRGVLRLPQGKPQAALHCSSGKVRLALQGVSRTGAHGRGRGRDGMELEAEAETSKFVAAVAAPSLTGWCKTHGAEDLLRSRRTVPSPYACSRPVSHSCDLHQGQCWAEGQTSQSPDAEACEACWWSPPLRGDCFRLTCLDANDSCTYQPTLGLPLHRWEQEDCCT